jgi:hypothetical protein
MFLIFDLYLLIENKQHIKSQIAEQDFFVNSTTEEDKIFFFLKNVYSLSYRFQV